MKCGENPTALGSRGDQNLSGRHTGICAAILGDPLVQRHTQSLSFDATLRIALV